MILRIMGVLPSFSPFTHKVLYAPIVEEVHFRIILPWILDRMMRGVYDDEHELPDDVKHGIEWCCSVMFGSAHIGLYLKSMARTLTIDFIRQSSSWMLDCTIS